MITAVVLTKNEEKHILDCLKSLSFCDEVLVIDDDSTDSTKKLAKEAGAVVIEHPLQENFSAQRNFALEKAKNDWVLFIDADEVVSKKLAEEIVSQTESETHAGYFIYREDTLFKKVLKHGELGNKKFVRLGKKGTGKWVGKVHETWNMESSIGTLKNPIMHTPHETLFEFISEINFYTTLRAKELHEQKVTSHWYSILLYTKGKFFQTYFLKLGFLDGVPGLIMSLMMTLHSFLVRSKLYLLQKKV